VTNESQKKLSQEEILAELEPLFLHTFICSRP
jgi:hypothetical protein